jgi:hypothetical protein
MVQELMTSVLKVANADRANIMNTILEQSPQFCKWLLHIELLVHSR